MPKIMSLSILGLVGIASSACTTTTYVSVPDPIPVIGAQLIGDSGSCAEVRDGATADGSPLDLFQCHGSPNQRWFISKGRISESFGSCIDVDGGTAREGAAIILVTCNGTPSQQWAIVNGQVVGIGGKCLDVMGGGTTDLTPLILAGCQPPPRQRWTVQ
jgi:hypothetical protein